MVDGAIVTGNYNNSGNTVKGTFTLTAQDCPLPNVVVTLADIMNGSSAAETTSAGTLAS